MKIGFILKFNIDNMHALRFVTRKVDHQILRHVVEAKDFLNRRVIASAIVK